MSELAMTDIENPSVRETDSSGRSQRGERDTPIRADRSLHQEPLEGNVDSFRRCLALQPCSSGSSLSSANHLSAIIIEPSYLQSTFASRNRAHGSACPQCCRDANGKHWHPTAVIQRPRKYPQSPSTTRSRSKDRNSSIRGQLWSLSGRNETIPNGGPHELLSDSIQSLSRQPKDLITDNSKAELERAIDGATLNGTTQKSATGIFHEESGVLSELSGITSNTGIGTAQLSVWECKLPKQESGSTLSGGNLKEPTSELKGDLNDDTLDGTPICTLICPLTCPLDGTLDGTHLDKKTSKK
ncbi:hypothetical protein F1880_005797 [Penicillium rolfsii]|nr:hypothetical protein F1880_005797 [Penicillium rolfsii]